jgi:predicted transposase YdaD
VAEEIHHPHDAMVRAVLSDVAEARSFLQVHLSEEVSQALNWSTLKLLAASHPALAWMERVAELWASLASPPPSGGINYVRLFVLYILATQEPEVAQSFREVLRRYAPEAGDDLMTYAQELLAEGREEGREEERVQMIENLLREGVLWSVIERVSGLNETQFQVLKQQVRNLDE